MKLILSVFSLFLFSTTHAATDLYIESVSYQYQGTTGYVLNNICNNGATENSNPRAHIRIVREGVWNVTEIQNIGKLEPQECYNMQVNYNLPQNERYQVVVLLDPKQQLADSDRSNNYVTANFVTPNSRMVKYQAVTSPSSFIDEFDKYSTKPVSAEIQAILGAQINTNTTNNSGAFPDTQANTLEDTAAAFLKDKGIIGGYPDGEFKGIIPVNRAEVAKFLLLANEIAVAPTTNFQPNFSDVPASAWFTPFIVEAETRGILEGYPDGTFRPAQTVNTVEFLKLITNVFSLEENLPHQFTDIEANAWYAPFVGVASQYNLFPDRGDQLNPSQDLTRAEVAIAIYKVLGVGE
jgi:hypothetical protein